MNSISMALSSYMNMNTLPENPEKYNLLAQIERQFKTKLGLTPCVGAEIEFYLTVDMDIALLEKFVGHSIKTEKGNNQYEIDLEPSCDLAEYAKHIELVRNKVILGAKNLGGEADFSSKPYANDYGNSMHIHLNFLEEWDVDKCAQILCHYLPEGLPIFLPHKDDWQRLDKDFMAPTHICYGGNNRTAAIRIPDSEPKRLEHRVSAVNADPALVIYEILNAMTKGLHAPEKIAPHPKIYGNAFDPQYKLIRLVYSRLRRVDDIFI